MSVKIVTGWSNLGFQPTETTPAFTSERQYAEYLDRMTKAVGADNIWAFWDYPFEELWAVKRFGTGEDLRPDTPTPADRYATPLQHVRSNLVQHQRTTWALEAAMENPEVTTWIWLDCGLLKQGGWRNNQITEEHIKWFFDKVSEAEPMDIPFPGISGKGPVMPGQNNWRFCGSTHIWPVKYLARIDKVYKEKLKLWTEMIGTMPLDLPIWAITEKEGILPFRQYKAEYDASQLTNYPG